MTASKTVPVYHHVDGLRVTCRRPASQGGSLTAKWSEVTCRDCLGVKERSLVRVYARRVPAPQRSIVIFMAVVILATAVLATAAIVESIHYHHACSDAGGVVVRGRCIDKSVVIDP